MVDFWWLFFSSRRRHTRCLSDWSSDVCSSDLEARQLNALFPPTLMDRHIGIHGFRSFAFVTGSGDNVYAVDTDLGRIDWQKTFGSKPAADASLTCPGGMTTGTARSIGAAFPMAMPGGRGGGGRGTPAKSG